MQNQPAKSPGIKEIASALGISIATVDRAFHNRPGVNATTRDRILKMAAKLGYRPNVAARALKLNRRLRIGVQLPLEIASFFDPLGEGIRAATDAMFGVDLDINFSTYPRLGSGDIDLLHAALKEKYDGLICTPGDAAKADPMIRELGRNGTAVICVASDAPRSERLASVSIDGYISGSLAAELLSHTLLVPGTVATITGALRTLDHAEKLRGFAATIALVAPHLSLLPVLESHDNPEEAYHQARNLLKSHPELRGLYISTANSLPVLRAVREHGQLGRLRIITTDLFEELLPMLETGEVLATLYQRPFTQGKTAAELLLRFLVEGMRPNSTMRLAPHIVLRSNASHFARYLGAAHSLTSDTTKPV
ncbi:MAG TPA: LacI family DNA-binding transcriptional regulator [Edaphobacter sp.]|nr:LacI family DNA-binding transcriptional regulator [Edaphobacter sp.]